MRRYFLFVLMCSFVSVAFAQDATKFLLRAGKVMSGTEEFTVHKTDSGYEIDGTTVIHQEGKDQVSKLHSVLNKDWTLVSYKNEITVPGGATITVTAKMQDQAVAANITWSNGSTRDRLIATGPKPFLLENFVPSHMETALKANADGGKFEAVLPSAMEHFQARVEKVGQAEGELKGKAVKLTHYNVLGGGPLIDAWTDQASGDLMRVYVPAQDVEYLRDGFKLTTSEQPAATKVSPPAGVSEREVTFISAGLKFPATLTLPAKSAAKLPVIVFVHGSGAHDRDETIGPNKPFQDLAWGLAQRGIASLRYDKRAFLHPNKGGLSLDTQVIADAAAALEFAATVPDVDRKRVFLLGHSLGAALAPYIAEKVTPRGMIMMASPARTMNEVIKDQIRLLLKSQGKSDAEIAAKVAEQDRVAMAVLEGKATGADVHGMIPLPLFKDMLSRDPADELKKVNVPALVLQGGKDAQVFQSDYDVLRDIVAQRPNSEAKLFPDLSHIFTPVQGTPDAFEALFKPGHVAPEVIDTIAAWVKKIQ